jgi:hypothetical protein
MVQIIYNYYFGHEIKELIKYFIYFWLGQILLSNLTNQKHHFMTSQKDQ